MKMNNWKCIVPAVAVMMASSSCHEWGQMDPPAANDIFPILENVVSYTFDDEGGLDPILFKTVSYPDGELPVQAEDSEKGQVLLLNNGYVSMLNPMNAVACQNGFSMTFWMKQLVDEGVDEATAEKDQDLTGALFGFADEENPNSHMFFTANGWLSYNNTDGEWEDNNPATYETGYLTPGKWHYVALIMRNTGYGIYVDGKCKVDKFVPDFDCSKVVQYMNNAPIFYLGAGNDSQTAPWMLDDLKIYRNQITSKEIARPNLGGGGSGPGGGGGSFEPIDPVYFNSFDGDNKDVTIHGAGEFKYVGGQWGTVYSNGMDGMRTNYLVLPSDVLSQCNGEALSISVWINRGNETNSGHYMWSPLISAYGAENTVDNTFPMFVAQYRGVLQTNCGGTWTDYTDAQNVAGVNTAYHDATDWIADGNWHNYTTVITPTHAVVYFDGEVANEWDMDGTDMGGSAAGLLSANNELSWICLGGNQAWNWGDPDPGFWFDDIAIYNKELSQETVKTLISMKNTNYTNTFSNGAGDATVVGAGGFIDNATPNFGKIFKNAVGGMRENYLKVPPTALAGIENTEQMTVAMWVNSTDAGDYFWNPLVTAYGDNGTNNPTFALQYRGIIAINTESPDNTGAEYCDFGPELSDNGEVILYHGDLDWLADKEWHLYTAVFDGLHFTVYFDGEVANSWTLDGTSRGQVCNYQAFPLLTNICICGNQQWDWGDPDPGFGIDDVMFYNRALSQSEIKQLMLWKK